MSRASPIFTAATFMVLACAQLLPAVDIGGDEDRAFDPNAPAATCPGFALISYLGPADQEELDRLAVSGIWTARYAITAWIDQPQALAAVANPREAEVVRHAWGLMPPSLHAYGGASAALADIAVVGGRLVIEREYRLDGEDLMVVLARERAGLADVTRLRAMPGIHARNLRFRDIAGQSLQPSLFLLDEGEHLMAGGVTAAESLIHLQGLLVLYRHPRLVPELRPYLYHYMGNCIGGEPEDVIAAMTLVADQLLPRLDQLLAQDGIANREAIDLINALWQLSRWARGAGEGAAARIGGLDVALAILAAELPGLSHDDHQLLGEIAEIREDLRRGDR